MEPMVTDGLIAGEDGVTRCWWPGAHRDYVAYHDREWGMPVRDDARLLEKLCLEGFQSGLSWLTILRKRERFRAAFADFDMDVVAGFDERDVARLLADAGIVRHRGKIEAAIQNARSARAVRDEFGSLARYLWKFEPEAAPPPRTRADLPAARPEAALLAKDLKRRGFRFCGPTTVYAFQQAMGMVNDHLHGCAARERVEAARRRFRRP